MTDADRRYGGPDPKPHREVLVNMSVDRRWPAAGLAGGLAVALVLGGAAPTRGAGWEPLRQVCQVQDTDITENSGMSRSTYRRSVMFVHNDSGGGPRFFAIGTGCRTKAVFDVPGAPAKDWEDMASGPGHTLWFGDIGGSRDEVETYFAGRLEVDASAIADAILEGRTPQALA